MNFKDINYIIKYPENFDENKKSPTILFLHGAGSRGNDIEKVKNNPFFTITKSHKDFEFAVFAPQCSTNTWFDLFEQLEEFAEFISKQSYVDSEKLYCMGPSMGGYATWQLAMSKPELFAAVVPICGGGMYWNAGRLANMGVWAFHGGKDNVVFCEESKKMVDAVNNCGGTAKLTVYPEAMHDSWTATYENRDVFNWLLKHKLHDSKASDSDKYNDSKIYG